VLNLKTFPPALGAPALRLAAQLEAAGRASGVAVAIAPALPDLSAVVRAVSIPVLAQHVDAGPAGARTGFLPVPALAAVGARGSLVNHSEHPVPGEEVGRIVAELAASGLGAVVCAQDPPTAGSLARYEPPYLAIEPPDLIGGDRAVSTAKPEVIVRGVTAVRASSVATVVLCGAGVHTAHDVRRALELGAQGVLVASAVALAPRPAAVLEDLLAGF
jgi:triosephosphate isomerase (TIM)